MTSDDLRRQLDAIFNARDRANMAPTIESFEALLAKHPGDPEVLFKVGGAYDTAGQEQRALEFYERALDAGLSGDSLRAFYLPYGSTLKNVGRIEESLAVFERAREQFPDDAALVVFHALTLHESGQHGAALGEVLTMVADRLDRPEIARYEPAIRGYAAALTEQA